MAAPIFEILALNYGGPVERPESFMRWLGDWSVMDKAGYFIWVIKPLQGDGPAIVIDAGLTPELAAKAGTPNYLNPAELLARIGLEAAKIEHLILTHLHFDHTSGLELFPKAKVYVQRTEFDFWIKDPLAARPPLSQLKDEKSLADLAALEGSQRLIMVEGDREILPGVECLAAPGHTPGLQAVALQTKKGRAVVGSDCGHTYRNFADSWPSCLIFDLPGWLNSFARLKSRVDDPELLFPGHDMAMAENFPEIAPRVTRLA